VHTKTTNHLGGYTQVDTYLDWAGKTIYTLTKHKRTHDDTELVVKDMFEYTPQDRLAVHKQQINNLPEQLLTKNTYDELGQLVSKKVGGQDVSGAASLQTVDYSYNIRGWLKTINNIDRMTNDLFAFKINYNEAETATPLFNGNIAETFWKTSSDNIKRKYNYSYDNLNRLLQADYSKEGSTTFNSYLEHLSYDKNGNIQTLLRNGDMDTDGMQFVNPIDNLTYLYDENNKNQLLRVFDATANPIGFKDDTNGLSINQDIDENPDYAYDANGNMTKDDNKGITNITYNHLNLPFIIYFADDNKITYLYNAIGQKLSKTVLQAGAITTTDYLGGFQYKNEVLQFFPHAEGYVNATQNGTSYTFNYVYNYTDHLGNIRLSYSQDPSTNVLKIIEENHYYPFGLKHTGYNSDQMMYVKEEYIVKIKPKPLLFNTSYNYKYNGKELQEELGLNMYDYGARNYDPALGRWMNIDPLVEKSRRWSPYTYCYNNPIVFVDPDGMFANPGDFYSQQGEKVGSDGKKDGKIYVLTDKNEVNAAKNATKKGLLFSKSDVKSEIELPSSHIRQEMGEAVDKSNNPSEVAGDETGGMHEEGGYYGTNAKGDEIVIDAQPGVAFEPGDAGAGVNVLKPGEQYEGQEGWRAKDNIVGTFHVHPKGDGKTRFVQEPSGADVRNSKSRFDSGMKGNHFVLGAGNNTVSIYKNGKVTATFPLDSFINLK
jgi:RHS repeat-associated protein